MDTLPSPLRRLIDVWTLDFERADAQERLAAYQDRAPLRRLCEAIRSNQPTYVFEIRTQRGAHIHMPITLPDCDPSRVRTGMRIPESHIVTWRRRANILHPPFWLEAIPRTQ
jgi:hypothetical protein